MIRVNHYTGMKGDGIVLLPSHLVDGRKPAGPLSLPLFFSHPTVSHKQVLHFLFSGNQILLL